MSRQTQARPAGAHAARHSKSTCSQNRRAAIGGAGVAGTAGGDAAALTSLMARLLLEHADKSRTGPRRRPVMISEKIRPHHLERKAILYVRQSSAHQVLHNRESSALQYAMRDRLTALGWSRDRDDR